MFSLLRGASCAAAGALGYDVYGHDMHTWWDAHRPRTARPTVVVDVRKSWSWPWAAVGAATLGALWFWRGATHVSAAQFKRAYTALDTNLRRVSKTLVRVKTHMAEKFHLVHRRLDDLENTIRTTSDAIRHDVAHVDRTMTQLSRKVDAIESQTRFSSSHIKRLCDGHMALPWEHAHT